METSRKKNFRTALTIAVIFGLMFILNHFMPIHRDDYEYSLVWNTARHISSITDIFESLYRHYMLHGGRMVTVFFLDLFLYLGKIWFDLANAAVFTGLVILMYLHCIRNLKLTESPGLLAVAGCLAWLSFPHFGEVAVWKSGSTVYLWSGFFVALFLLPYNLVFKSRVLPNTGGVAMGMFVLGLVAGCSVENLAVTTVVLTGLISLYFYKIKKEPYNWMPMGCLGALLGFIVILVAPGNFVRYAEQGTGKGILIHIGNQFAGNGEMLLYILPMVLFIILMYRTLQRDIVRRDHISIENVVAISKNGRLAMLGGILLLVVSYFSGGFIARSIRDFLIYFVMTPLGLTRPKTIHLFSNVMAGFEEMAIYWLLVFFFFSVVKEKLGLTQENRKLLDKYANPLKMWKTYPELKFPALMFLLAFFNNFVMIAAPTFPARATFSSVAMIIIGTLSLMQLKVVENNLLEGRVAHILKVGAAAVTLFTFSASLVIYYQMHRENAVRIAIVKEAGEQGVMVPSMPPLPHRQRALRHVYFEDFGNGVTKKGLVVFYGIEDIKVDEEAKVPQ